MAKFASDFMLDASLSVVSKATRMVALVGHPASFSAADAGKLVEAVMVPADFIVSNGDISGRKVAVAAKLGLNVLTPGTADHVALLDDVGSRLLYVTTCPDLLMHVGGTVNIATWKVEIGDLI